MDISLRERLESLQEMAASNRYYIPDGYLERVLTRAVIQEIIEKNEPRFLNSLQILRYVQIVLDDALKITAILVLLGKEHLLVRNFVHKQLFDRRLPLSDVELESTDESRPFAKQFCIRQYIVLAPHFRKGAIHWALDGKYILPFEKDDQVPGAAGAFGNVFKVEIHAAHQSIDTSSDKPSVFARKEFKLNVTTETDFEAEKAALELLLELKHQNIIELFATYAYGPYFNLLMPWADLTLFSYLRSALPPKNADERVALFEEMACVASALNSIHNFEIEKDGIKFALIGCHHDLKPQNILVRGRKFLIADFGLARFKELNQQSETKWKLGTRTYGPPEAGSGTKVSRPHDIWSFGCILIEVTTFALLGPSGVDDFAHRRITETAPGRSNDYFHNNKAVKLEVLDWLKHLNKLVDDSTLISSVTNLIFKLLDPNPTTRPRSKSLQLELSQIVEIYKVYDSACIRENEAQFQTVMEIDRDENRPASAAIGNESRSHLAGERCDCQNASLGVLTNSSILQNAKKTRSFGDATWPIIHIAAMKGENQTVLRILKLEHPHTSIATNDDGNTALHIAAEYGQEGVVGVFLAFASSYSLLPSIAFRKNASGKTPLHLAAENGKKECAVKLRQSMSDADHVRDLLEEKDDLGNTPLDLAQQNGHNFMLGCLSSAAFCY